MPAHHNGPVSSNVRPLPMISYRYARGNSGRVIDVSTLCDANRREFSPYICLGCEGELTPNLPKFKSKHFSHRPGSTCSGETYLHNLAKKLFYDRYSLALAEGRPFNFSFSRPTQCEHYKNELGIICSGSTRHQFDLTKAYRTVVLEKASGDFQPDVTLKSERHAPIFIEIAVTHFVTREKIESNEKIIEIKVESEEDLAPILADHISDSLPKIKIYNIRGKPIEGNICSGKCTRKKDFFVVYQNGKVRIATETLENMARLVPGTVFCALAIEAEGKDRSAVGKFLTNLRHYYFQGASIKNCLLCKNHGIGERSATWCRKMTKHVKSNDAASCEYYSPFGSFAESIEAENKNWAEVRVKGEALVEAMLKGYR